MISSFSKESYGGKITSFQTSPSISPYWRTYSNLYPPVFFLLPFWFATAEIAPGLSPNFRAAALADSYVVHSFVPTFRPQSGLNCAPALDFRPGRVWACLRFSVGVHHSRLPGVLFLLSPSLWLHTWSEDGGGAWKALHTRRWRRNEGPSILTFRYPYTSRFSLFSVLPGQASHGTMPFLRRKRPLFETCAPVSEPFNTTDRQVSPSISSYCFANSNSYPPDCSLLLFRTR